MNNTEKFLPKSVMPLVESKLERAQTGGWGRGPGNNVSAVMCGVNAAQGQMAAHMDEKFSQYFRDKKKARKANRHLAGKRKFDVVNKPVNVQAPQPIEKQPHLSAGSCDVALSGWQTHALNRLRGKR